MKKVFISRDLKPTSPIRAILHKHNLVAQSLIEISKLEFEKPDADWIFFYSRNGVKYFFEEGNYALYPYLWACLSEGTADELSHYVTDISFIGSGTSTQIAKAFEGVTTNGQVTCFIRAKNSLDSIHKRIDKPEDFSIPVYSNHPSDRIPNGHFDILIFTSPMNVDAWINKREITDEKIISIGTTTADHLIAHGITDVTIAKSPTENAIAEALAVFL